MKRSGFAQKPRKPMARISKNPANVALRKKKKRSKADIKREWDINPAYRLRYESPIQKGILWYWFARYVRLRDFQQWGRCISCNKPKTFDELQAGHFISAGDCGLDLLFDESNVHGECGYCNGIDEHHLRKYERNLDERYGSGTAAILDERYELRHQVQRKIGVAEFESLARHYKAEYESLLT